jgi:hypothetical protein
LSRLDWVAASNDAAQIAAPRPAHLAQDPNEIVEARGARSFSNCEQQPVASNETLREEMPKPSQKPESPRKLWSGLELRTVLLSSSLCLPCCTDTNGISEPKLKLLINNDLFVPLNPRLWVQEHAVYRRPRSQFYALLEQEPPTLLSGYHQPVRIALCPAPGLG